MRAYLLRVVQNAFSVLGLKSHVHTTSRSLIRVVRHPLRCCPSSGGACSTVMRPYLSACVLGASRAWVLPVPAAHGGAHALRAECAPRVHAFHTPPAYWTRPQSEYMSTCSVCKRHRVDHLLNLEDVTRATVAPAGRCIDCPLAQPSLRFGVPWSLLAPIRLAWPSPTHSTSCT